MSLRAWKKIIIKLFTGLGSVCIVKNCDLGLENAIFSQPANNIYILKAGVIWIQKSHPFLTYMWEKLAGIGMQFRTMYENASEIV